MSETQRICAILINSVVTSPREEFVLTSQHGLAPPHGLFALLSILHMPDALYSILSLSVGPREVTARLTCLLCYHHQSFISLSLVQVNVAINGRTSQRRRTEFIFSSAWKALSIWTNWKGDMGSGEDLQMVEVGDDC